MTYSAYLFSSSIEILKGLNSTSLAALSGQYWKHLSYNSWQPNYHKYIQSMEKSKVLMICGLMCGIPLESWLVGIAYGC